MIGRAFALLHGYLTEAVFVTASAAALAVCVAAEPPEATRLSEDRRAHECDCAPEPPWRGYESLWLHYMDYSGPQPLGWHEPGPVEHLRWRLHAFLQRLRDERLGWADPDTGLAPLPVGLPPRCGDPVSLEWCDCRYYRRRTYSGFQLCPDVSGDR